MRLKEVWKVCHSCSGASVSALEITCRHFQLKTCYSGTKKIETGEFFLFCYNLESATWKEIATILCVVLRLSRNKRVLQHCGRWSSSLKFHIARGESTIKIESFLAYCQNIVRAFLCSHKQGSYFNLRY